MTCRMSLAGEVGNSAAMNSIFSSMKTERVARKGYRTRVQAQAGIFDCSERLYNPTRRHSTIEYVAPVQFEQGDRA
jgi:putative transposase